MSESSDTSDKGDIQIKKDVFEYVVNTIIGCESGLFKVISNSNPNKTYLLKDVNQPFAKILKESHETYFTNTHQSIIKRDDSYVNEIFDNLQNLTNHSKQCILNILAHLTVSIHFNIDRHLLNIDNHDSYISSIRTEALILLNNFQFRELFEHPCIDVPMELLPDGKNFITIDIKMPTEKQKLENDLKYNDKLYL